MSQAHGHSYIFGCPPADWEDRSEVFIAPHADAIPCAGGGFPALEVQEPASFLVIQYEPDRFGVQGQRPGLERHLDDRLGVIEQYAVRGQRGERRPGVVIAIVCVDRRIVAKVPCSGCTRAGTAWWYPCATTRRAPGLRGAGSG